LQPALAIPLAGMYNNGRQKYYTSTGGDYEYF
jgi:hypothetical protein